MFVEFLIKKVFQSCSTRTGFTPTHNALVALSVANNLLDQVFVCQLPVHCINYRNNILMSTANVNRVSKFWASQNTPFGLKVQDFENPIFIFGSFFLKAVYKQYHVLLYSHWYSLSFEAPTYWNHHLYKCLLPDNMFQWW